MGSTFSGCSSLATLDVSGWDTQNVTNMNPFSHMKKLTRLDVSGWSTESVTSFANVVINGFYRMFNDMPSLAEIIFGEGWGKNAGTPDVENFLHLENCNSSGNYKLTDATWASMLTMYDRKTAGLPDMTLSFSTRHNIPDGWAEKMVARGYAITLV